MFIFSASIKRNDDEKSHNNLSIRANRKNLEERIDIEKLVVITGYSRRSLQDFFLKKSVESLSENISDNAS